MALSSNSIITWSDLANTCYNAIISACCNIDNMNNVPLRLQNGNGYLAVKSIENIGISGSKSKWTATWYANGTNLVSVVSSSTVYLEWSTFLFAAGINSRSNKVIQAKELGLAIGLYQQFLAFHLKPIYSRRQIYNTAEAQTIFRGTKYIIGNCTPKYILTAIDPDNFSVVTDSDITNVVNQAVHRPNVDWGMLDNINNPVVARHYLS